MLTEHFSVIFLATGFIAIAYCFAMGTNPSSRFFRCLERGFGAVVLLYLWNAATPVTLQLGVNPLTLAFAALSGVPGLAAMSAVKLLN